MVAGLEWVGLNHKLPAVVTMSLGVKVCYVTLSDNCSCSHTGCVLL